MVEVTVYRRPGCHLCDEAREAILALAAELEVRLGLREIDIESDDALLRRYVERIPVVAVNGTIVSELVPDTDALRAAVVDTLRS